jgi:HEPN domain-containing protein
MQDKALIAEWIRYTKSDLNTARHMFEDVYPKETEISAYHCQQCAEKALKAFLVANDIDPPKIHNLRRLCALCKAIDGGFSVLEADCESLNPLGAVARYPNELAPDEAITKAAIERAQKVCDFCIARIKDRGLFF